MIPLYVQNGIAYVWNSNDWYRIRSEYRICGNLIGSIASFPRQNDFLGLPMALMSEEAALLVEKGICELYELPNIGCKPSGEEKTKAIDFEKRLDEEQINVLKKRRIQKLSQKIDIIVAGKKHKLMSKGITDVEIDKEKILEEEINKLPAISSAHILVHLPSEHFRPTEIIKIPINNLKPSIVDKDGTLRYSVFKDLWERGHYITSGCKFGSDYLAYSGDPVRFHATYMVKCVNDMETLFQPANLVTYGRLSEAVNKLAVLAFSNSNGKIDYQTLQWHDSLKI